MMGDVIIHPMSAERRPLRHLKRFERLLARLGRCPTCHRQLASVPHDDVASWHNQPHGIVKTTGAFGASGHGRMQRGYITQLHHRKIPYCPKCQHTFIHGWIYPVGAPEPGDTE